MKALFGLLLGGERVHSNAAGFSSGRSYKAQVKELISHVRWLSETICFQSGGCMLIAEVGAPIAAHSALQTSDCEKTWLLRTLGLTFRHSNIARSNKVHNTSQNWMENRLQGCGVSFIGVLYRSWVPDEDLGAAVSELVFRDLKVGNQRLDSFPMGSQKGHMGHSTHT